MGPEVPGLEKVVPGSPGSLFERGLPIGRGVTTSSMRVGKVVAATDAEREEIRYLNSRGRTEGTIAKTARGGTALPVVTTKSQQNTHETPSPNHRTRNTRSCMHSDTQPLS